MKYIPSVIRKLFLSFLVSCGSQRTTTMVKTASTESTKVVKKTPVKVKIQKVEGADLVLEDLKNRKPHLSESTLDYIDEYNDIAILEMLSYDIPASITLAQGILESNSGRSRLAARGNNHFGVKCHKSWNGDRIYHDDDARQECFRKYDHPFTSFRDHSLFLYGRDRYASLFTLHHKDYKGWSKGLKKAGYATDPKYPNKLIHLIENYELYKYDDFDNDFQYNGQVAKKQDVNSYKNDYIVVNKGDTLYSIATSNNLTVDKLKWINGLKSNEISIGQKLYVK